jgi:hypothetical protein
MSARDLLPALTAAGLTVGLDADGALLVGPRDRLTDDLRVLIRSRKADLLDALSAASVPGYRPADDGASDTGGSGRRTSLDETAELRAMLDLLAFEYRFTDSERSEALDLALADAPAALLSFRAQLPALAPVTESMPDTRQTCRQCARWTGRHCAVAGTVELRRLHDPLPYPDLQQRCPAYRTDC